MSMTLPQTLTRIQIKTGWSKTRLGREVGVDASSIRAWEAGKRLPRAKHLLALAELGERVKVGRNVVEVIRATRRAVENTLYESRKRGAKKRDATYLEIYRKKVGGQWWAGGDHLLSRAVMKLRVELGLSRREFAEKMVGSHEEPDFTKRMKRLMDVKGQSGVRPHTVYLWESERVRPSKENLEIMRGLAKGEGREGVKGGKRIREILGREL